jgi:hypothetical protein
MNHYLHILFTSALLLHNVRAEPPEWLKALRESGSSAQVQACIRGGDDPVNISLDVTGAWDLVLLAGDAGDGKRCDHAVWTNAKLIDEHGNETWLDSLQPVRKKVGALRYAIGEYDTANPVLIGDEQFPRYIFAHAPSKLIYKLRKKYVRFEAQAGIDQRRHKGKGSVTFHTSTNPGDEPLSTEDVLFKKVRADFPEKTTEILLERDWHRQDGLNLFSSSNNYEAAAKKMIKLARETLTYVGSDALKPEFESLKRKTDKGGDWEHLWRQAHQLRRRIILSHPALDFEQILVNVNPPTTYSHNGDQHLGRHSRSGPGLTLLSNWKSNNIQVKHILKDKLPEGATRNPDLHYDAEKVVFAFCDHTRSDDEHQRRYFLYEAATDGSWIRQLTGTAEDPFETWENRATSLIEDNDPCYLPDDHIVFISSRCQTFGRCHGSRYNPAWVLHRCDPNGAGIRQLSFGNENEYEPAVLNDGRIIFTRWEYTNRHEMYFHMLWWCRPDGTAPSHYYGNDTIHPMEVIEATAIPGSHKVVATAAGHHSYTTGTSILLDVNKGENGEAPVTHLTPETPYPESKGWPKPHYSHPYPVTEELYLVSRANHPIHRQGMAPPPNNRGIYLIDPLGGRELIYEHPEFTAFSPIAVRQRMRPPVIPSTLSKGSPPEATLFLQNAYLTRNDPDGIIQPGMIKALRINALGVQPRAAKRPVSMTVRNEIPKRIIGTVPVNEDGSTVFKVPANMSLQIQTLDENGMALLTEKSLFYLQSGESRSCIGCHEPEGSSPDMAAIAGLSRMEPSVPNPPAGPQYEGGLSFMRTVQPVLDRYCIDCHGLGQSTAEANQINLIYDGNTKGWPRSYRELVERGNHRVGDKRYMSQFDGELNISRPRQFYAYGNAVAHMLLENHGDCDMDNDSYMRIIEFLDLNAQFYGDLFPVKMEDRTIDKQKLAVVEECASKLFGEAFVNQPERALINTVQIDESRILMAPMPVNAGGWGQIEGYTGKDDPDYIHMEKLVNDCIIKCADENINGWAPSIETGSGEKWVIDSREKYKANIQ